MRLTEGKVKAALKQNGYKLTQQRRSVIKAVVSSRDRLTPADLYNNLHQDHPNIGLVTVYRTLGILDGLGLICKVHASGNCHSCTIGTTERHHHLICSNCGKVIDFSCSNLTELKNKLSRETGFDIEDHLLEFVGHCRNCQKGLA
jgi:Fur family ferric uptake transcriptional regulator